MLDILRMGKINHYITRYYVEKTRTIVPNVFYAGLRISVSLRDTWINRAFIHRYVRLYL